MRRSSLLRLVGASVVAVSVLASCASLKPLDARYVKVDPQPLEVRGGKIPTTITIDFPAKWFHKNAEVRVTPVLRYTGGEAWGTTTYLQGEKVRGNGRTISQMGGKVTIESDFVYKPEMRQSDLYLTFISRIGTKEVSLPAIKVGEGVVATETLADAKYAEAALAPDKFQRIIKEQYDANIHFLIQQANIRTSEAKSSAVQEWEGVVKNADITPNQNVSVEVQAYASPDGGIELNERLAAQRERNTTDYLKKQLKREKVDVPLSAHYTAQDWEGFKELVAASNIQDKELVLRVLSMYPDPEVREREIKNISSVFSQLADDVLPKLRRSRLIANIEIIGKSDEELAKLSKTSPGSLSLDELLYSATLFDDKDTKKAIYTTATQLHPSDARAFNNLGVLAYAEGQYDQAAQYFSRAERIANIDMPGRSEAEMNLGLIALRNGELAKAEQRLGNAAQVPELGQALGLMYLKQGRYTEAAQALGETPSNNAVLANLLNRDYNKALRLADRIANKDAVTHYLLAILGARTAQPDLVRTGIREAIRLDPGIAVSIAKDREFARYASESFFTQAIQGR